MNCWVKGWVTRVAQEVKDQEGGGENLASGHMSLCGPLCLLCGLGRQLPSLSVMLPWQGWGGFCELMGEQHFSLVLEMCCGSCGAVLWFPHVNLVSICMRTTPTDGYSED